MSSSQTEAGSFGQINELYHSSRPGYPDKLLDDILECAKVPYAGTILDIGCGTGQITLPLLKRGYKVTGLDISSEMIEIAERQSAGYSTVEFIIASFDKHSLPATSFNLIISGMAWHWVAIPDRYNKVRRLLKEGGSFACIWYHQQKEQSSLVAQVSELLGSYGGKNRGPAGSAVVETVESVFDELAKSGAFNSIKKLQYHDKLAYSSEKYLDLVESYGWIQQLTEEQKKALLSDLRKLFETQSEPFLIPYAYELVMAKAG